MRIGGKKFPPETGKMNKAITHTGEHIKLMYFICESNGERFNLCLLARTHATGSVNMMNISSAHPSANLTVE